MGIAAAYKRRRHTIGFGVHSPLAYRVVRDCVMQKDSYYAYAELDSLLDVSRPHRWRRRRRTRMLHRLAARLPRPTIALSGSVDAATAAAVSLALPHARVAESSHSGHTLCVAAGSLGDFEPLDGNVLFAFDITSADIELLWSRMQWGVMLYDRDAMIVVADKGVTKLRYSVRL